MTYLLIHEGEDREYLLAAGETLETDLGVLEVPDDPEPGQIVETHLDEPFTVRELRGPDLFNHLERTGAPMMPRDIGIVVGKTGLQSGDRVLDAGTGTGVLAAYLARMGVTVTTYERDPEFADVARENMAMAGVEDRVDVRSGDVTEAVDALAETDFDVVTLDTGDAAAVVERAPELLVPGGFLAVYSPFVEQAREAIQTARDAGLRDAETLETIQRALDVSDRGTRPSTRGVGHTGYLTFARNP
ncbi:MULTISPECIES: tRNA (adenine-N1)-methyltransferase [Halomicrobium]|uniref:Methyltransferase small n=2 Tax=Halomicrobium mukohataei TaxID=57705 RepID=C7P2H4_HALMD|nr:MULTISPECIES: tRNA (adenine-N1)-methyltransferase [Halomicrobium]ACV49289.1 methyltransferase small [Halomicrobium mukohataei DSM 12286]QCD64688.1 tRNA (adenine-N1)-methyltransferase [Halomicrobium mukohataei]QFR19495.1 methyltransferase domain-containing protein [Halomicrobium sp. ZPS1]